MEQLRRVRDLGVSTVSTYIPWLWHEPFAKQFDFTGKSHPQRDLVRFLVMANDLDLTVFIRPGPYVMAELRQEGLPVWIAQNYPELLARGTDGQLHSSGAVSYLHPTFLGLVDRWYRTLALAIQPYFAEHGGPIILTQLDNEVGMLHWVSGVPDHHPMVQNEYIEFCRKASVSRNPASYWSVAEFWRDYRSRYVRHLATLVEQQRFPGPYVINVHGFRDFSIYSRGVDYPVGLSELASLAGEPNTVLGGDFYPGHVTYDNFHDLSLATMYTCAMNPPDAAAFSPEFQSGRFQDRPHVGPSDLDLSARISIAHGLNGLNWYMLSSGENPADIGVFGRHHNWQAPMGLKGEYRPGARVVRHVGALIHDYGTSLVLSRSKPDIYIGYYSPYYMTENAPEAIATETEVAVVKDIVRERETFHFDGIYRLMIAANIPVEALWLDDPRRGLDSGSCPALWVATTRYMDETTQRRLAHYVLTGGILFIGPEVPDRDLSGHPCRVLLDALGVPNPIGAGVAGVATVGTLDSVYCPKYRTFPENLKSHVLGRVAQAGMPEEPVTFQQRAGQGSVIVVGIGFSAIYDTYTQVIRALVGHVLKREVSLQSSNPLLHVVDRTGPEGSFLFVHNLHDFAQNGVVTRFEDNQIHESWQISLEPRQGLMLPHGGVPIDQRRWLIEYTTAEITTESSNHLCIHRGRQAGLAKLRWMGPKPPQINILSGFPELHYADNLVTIRWSEEETPQAVRLSPSRVGEYTSDADGTVGHTTVPIKITKEDF